jgi:membrane associated rhomboid family serine protease
VIVLPLILLGLSWLQEGIDQLLLGGRWNLAMGPGTPWWTLLTAPFSHGDLGHLIGNSIVFLPLSYLVLLKSLRGYVAVWIAVILLEIPLWMFWPVGSHGLSGVIYGLLGYLVLIGFLERRPLAITLSVIAVAFYGSTLPGLLPWASPAGVSWIAHASGFIAGLLAAGTTSREPHQPSA